MKLAMATGSLSRDAGGLFESVRALGKGLAESGVEVEVCGLWDRNWEVDGGAWAPLKAAAFRYHGPRALAWSPAMDAALAGFSPDVVHLNGLWQYPSVATHRLWKRRGTPYVVSPRGMLDAWALANSRWKKRMAAWAFEDAVMRGAACLHALCEAEADSIRAYGLRQRIEVVPNGVGLPEISTTENTEGTEGKKRLVFLGRIHPKKGLVGLVRAWAGLKRDLGAGKFSEWELVVAGWDQGGHEGELRTLCAEMGLAMADGEGRMVDGGDVVFRGPVFGMEKEGLLRGADAFVLPSFSEGLPMSVLEAWSYGLPVVMTPECNLPEGFASGAALEIRNHDLATSYSLPATPTKLDSDWDGLREFIEMTDSERREMGVRGRRLVEERFTWPKVAARMREIFEDLVGRG
jgi:poly(glycerol-phosphate) alpha-glucosyltransferase